MLYIYPMQRRQVLSSPVMVPQVIVVVKASFICRYTFYKMKGDVLVSTNQGTEYKHSFSWSIISLGVGHILHLTTYRYSHKLLSFICFSGFSCFSILRLFPIHRAMAIRRGSSRLSSRSFESRLTHKIPCATLVHVLFSQVGDDIKSPELLVCRILLHEYNVRSHVSPESFLSIHLGHRLCG